MTATISIPRGNNIGKAILDYLSTNNLTTENVIATNITRNATTRMNVANIIYKPTKS